MKKKIKVHEKALAHLSRGLYRSPASALRELVSNAWDANATTVRIDTNYPNFSQISVKDNGDGFTKEEFERLMAGGIGNSQKRPKHLQLKYGRPTIGRLGIGLLGIAQICGSFTIVSKTRSGKGFRARVNLYDLLKERLDSNQADVVQIGPSDQIVKEVDVGEYELETFDAESTKNGTLLIADDVHPTFTRSFAESTTFEKFTSPSLDWSEALDVVSQVHSLQELGDYWKLLWELAASCPVRYLDKNAVPGHLINDDQERLTKCQFDVIVDGISLRKPVHLSGNPGGYSTWNIDPVKRQVYGKPLTFHGYVLVQEGAQLKPDELRGILIRIKNISIGYYDPSLLDYRYNEGPRSRWITGEIYVDEGLEDALNIDRDSFNRFHPEFRVVQQFIHKLLREDVFPKTYKKIEARSEKKRELRIAARHDVLGRAVSKVLDRQITVRPVETHPEGAARLVGGKGSSAVLRVSDKVQTKKSNRQLAGAILAIFDIALTEKSKTKQKEVFERLVLELLAKW